MRLGISAKTHAFTLIEMAVAMTTGSAIVGVAVLSLIALERSFNSTENYIATQTQQIRIVDFLARDVRRGLSVVSSVDEQTVQIQIPKYIIQAGDPEAILNPSLIGTPRSPSRAIVSRDYNINYGSATSSVEYVVDGASIERWEDGVRTTIASSTDNLLPQTIDTELANTEYTSTSITFKPISVTDRSGTIVYTTAYLRNRRRPPP